VISSCDTDTECVLHLLSHLYAHRSASLWKAPALGPWLASAVSAALPSLPNAAVASNALFNALFGRGELAAAVFRHAAVQDAQLRPLLAFVPRSVAARTAFAGDPLPPATAVSTYDDGAFLAGADETDLFALAGGSQRARARELEEVIPDPAARAQLRALFEAHPALAARFPGGIAQFAQLAAQLDEGALDGLMVELAEAAVAMGDAGGEMPGAMPGAADGPGEWEVDFGAVPQERPAADPLAHAVEGAGEDDEGDDARPVK
jgi:hypothetical protein